MVEMGINLRQAQGLNDMVSRWKWVLTHVKLKASVTWCHGGNEY